MARKMLQGFCRPAASGEIIVIATPGKGGGGRRSQEQSGWQGKRMLQERSLLMLQTPVSKDMPSTLAIAHTNFGGELCAHGARRMSSQGL